MANEGLSSPLLDLHFSVLREARGREPWEEALLARPLHPQLLRYVAESDRRQNEPNGYIETLLYDGDAAPTGLRATLRAVAAEMQETVAVRRELLRCDERQDNLQAAILQQRSFLEDVLRVPTSRRGSPCPPVWLVPFSPYPPTYTLVKGSDRSSGSVLGVERLSEPAVVQTGLTIEALALLDRAEDGGEFRRALAGAITHAGEYGRVLLELVQEIVVTLSAAYAGQGHHPSGLYDANVLYGFDLRYARLYPIVRDIWLPFLDGDAGFDSTVGNMRERLATYPAQWYVDQVDMASIAADFYALEIATAQGHAGATIALAVWEDDLARYLARHLVTAIGTELCHTGRIDAGRLRPDLGEFVRALQDGSALLTWPYLYEAEGSGALTLAEEVFGGPGLEFGGEAWSAVANLLRKFNDGAIGSRVFIDQCFTLEHNNGSLFDKYTYTGRMAEILSAQAGSNIEELLNGASAGARAIIRVESGARDSVATRKMSGEEPLYDGQDARIGVLGAVGCGCARERLEAVVGDLTDEAAQATVLSRRAPLRRQQPAPASGERPKLVCIVTDEGRISVRLSWDSAPVTCAHLVGLATGTSPWTDPVTGAVRREPFYDGTTFHRVRKGFVIQAGDRSETGFGGPGFRLRDELSAFGKFDRPYLVAMANLGRNTTGSQFFITLAPLAELDGQYAMVGEVEESSRSHVTSIVTASEAGGRISILRVEVG